MGKNYMLISQQPRELKTNDDTDISADQKYFINDHPISRKIHINPKALSYHNSYSYSYHNYSYQQLSCQHFLEIYMIH